jgi:Pectate lyase superfamily protein
MPDSRISELPAATSLADADIAPIVQSVSSTFTTRRTTVAQLRGQVLADRGVHVRDYGAKGDGSTNDAPAFQAAVNDVLSRGGGVVHLGPRPYRIASAIFVNNSMVRLQGAGFTEAGDSTQGTRLFIDQTNFTPFRFIGVAARGSGVADLAVLQAHSTTFNAGWAATDYPYVFRVEDCLGGVDFDNVLLGRVNRGIYARNSGRLDIRRLRGQVFRAGVEIDECLDVPRIHNLHFWTFWSGDDNVVRWQQANGDAVIVRRCDGIFIDQAFALGYRSMFRFAGSAVGAPPERSGTVSKFYIANAYADFVKYGVWVEADGVDGQIGNLTTQGEIFGAGGTPVAGAHGILVDASGARIQVGNLRVDDAEDNAVRVEGSGNRLDVFSLRCTNYNTRDNGAAAIHLADTGAAAANAVFLGSPPLLENGNGGPAVNGGTNGVLQMQAPAGRVARPGLAVGGQTAGLFSPASGVLAASASGAEVLRASTGTLTLGGAPGGHGLEVTTPPNAANRIVAAAAAAGGAVSLQAQGADANVSIDLTPKGSGQLRGPTPPVAENSTALATTAWVRAQGYGTGGGGGGAVTSVAGRTGAVTLAVADVAGAAPLADPAFTGSLTLPSWTIAGRPSPAVAGMIGWNTELGRFDLCTAPGSPGTWRSFLRLEGGDTATGPLLANSNGAGNAARLSGSAAGGNVVIGVDPAASSDTNVGVALGTPKGTGAISAQVPDGTGAGGNPRGSNAVDWQLNRNTAAQIASGANAVIGGGLRNTASGPTTTVSGGQSNSASATWATVGGGQSNTASGSTASVGGGQSNAASANWATVGGGQSNTASGIQSWIPGGLSADTRNAYGKGAWASGTIGAAGDAQAGEQVLRRQGADATAIRLTADNTAPGNANTANLPNNGTYLVRLMAIARQTGGTAGTVGDSAAWEVAALVRRGANAASTVLVGGGGALVAPAFSDAGAAAWRLSVAADTTAGGLAVLGTGEAAKTVNWVARILSVEAVG